MSKAEGLVHSLPDLYSRRKHKDQTKPNSYELELPEPSVPSLLLRKRIRAHCDVADEAEYQYSHVLFVCTNKNTESRLQRMLGNVVHDFEFWTITTEHLESEELKIWSEMVEEDEEGEPILKSIA